MTGQILRIEQAQAMARLFRLLYKLKIISYDRLDKLVDHLTVLSFESQMAKEKADGELSSEE
jgi:hypothetical protein